MWRVAVLALVGCATAESGGGDPAGAAPVVVHTVEVQQLALTRPVHGAGRLASAEEVTLSFPAGGVLARVEVEAGDRVRRGQVLAVLDATPVRSQLDNARSALERAERDHARALALEGTALTRQQREDATTGLAVARANVEAAEFAVRRSSLVAPTDGVILDRFADPNQTVGAGTPVVRLGTDASWELAVAVPAADALRIEPGLPAEVHLSVYGERAFPGQVVRKSGGLGTWHVTVALAPVDVPLASGLIGSADLAPAAAVGPVVPLSALAEVDGSIAAVYTIDDGVARRVPVRLAFFSDDQVALAAPIAAERVVDLGAAFVRDGLPVTEVR
ncbi:MAG: efflux RND transporter periplasmic adaptor subunit [Myxococcota bacterium]